jgi:Domain of unknown function (DUF4150)
MAKPIALAKGIAFAFPDVCKTPAPPGSPIPLPYPNIASLAQASPVTDAAGKELLVGPAGDHALLKSSTVSTSTGDEPGSVGGVKSGGTKAACSFTQASASVVYGPAGDGLVRFLDTTDQNGGNARGVVLSAFPTVLVGD